jgi:hypothetical protein
MTIANPPPPASPSRPFQFRIATLLIAMVGIGLACAALATPTPFWVSVLSAITLLSLLLSVLLIIYRRDGLRAFAVGFLVFGGTYGAYVSLIESRQAFANGPGHQTVLPTTRAIGWLYLQYHAKITRLSSGGGMGGMGGMGGGMRPVPVPRYLYQYFYQAAQFVFTMLLGGLGGSVAQWLYATQRRETTTSDSQ